MATQTRPVYDPSQRYELRVFDVEYRHDGDASWLLRIYQPQGTGPFPALMDVHGGAWTYGDRTQNELVDTALASTGLVVAAVEFRLSGQGRYPAQVQDTHLATRWFKAHAGEFNALVDGIGGLGTSSGAHTLLLSALRPHDPRYAAFPLPEAPEVDSQLSYLLLLWGVLDPYARYLFAKREYAGHTEGMTGGLARNSLEYFGSEEAMQEGNPQAVVEQAENGTLPPALIIQGVPDTNIPRELPERFSDAYRKAGGSIDLEWFPGSPHGFMRKPGPDTDRALLLIKDFIARQLT